MTNVKKIFPSNLPYITKKFIFIPDDMVLSIKGLIGNDIFYLLLYYVDNAKSNLGEKNRLLNSLKKSRTTEWRRKKRLQKLGLI